MKIEANIYFGDNLHQIVIDEELKASVRHSVESSSDTSVLLALSFIARVLEALANRTLSDHTFNPSIAQEDYHQLIRCRWRPTGTLRIINENETRRWDHAETVLEAVRKQRTFTCTRAILKQLPEKREQLHSSPCKSSE